MKRLVVLALIVAALPATTTADLPDRTRAWPRLDDLGPPETGTSVTVDQVDAIEKNVQSAQPFAPDRGRRRLQASFTTAVFSGIRDRTGTNPPDANGDVGPAHYVQTVNQSDGAVVGVFDKQGQRLADPFKLGNLWDEGPCRHHGKGDPVVRYDSLADRWVLSQLAFRLTRSRPPGPFYVCVFVSGSPDPLGGGFAYAFFIDETVFPDYPKLGVWPDGYYMSMHLFGGRGFEGQAVIALDRESMLAGLPADQVVFFVNPRDYGVLPSSLEGPAPPPEGTPNYLAVAKDDDLGAPRDRLKLYAFRVDWSDVRSSRIDLIAQRDVEAFDAKMCRHAFSCIPQRGTRMKLDALVSDPPGVFTMHPTSYRNFGSHDVLIFNHTVQVGRRRAGIRWYEIRDLATTPAIFQYGTLDGGSLSRWVGSIAMAGDGNIAIGYSTSSRRDHPSIHYSARLAGDAPGVMGLGEHLLVQGEESQKTSARWGDYTSMSVDPTDDCTFWYTNQFYPDGARRWRTAIATLQLPGCSQ